MTRMVRKGGYCRRNKRRNMTSKGEDRSRGKRVSSDSLIVAKTRHVDV